MNILIDAGNYFANNDNHGDRAIYQIIIRRLLQLWPDSKISWITRNGELLNAISANLSPLLLTHDRYPLPLNDINKAIEKVSIKSSIKNALYGHDTDHKINLSESSAFPNDSIKLLDAIKSCDLVIATGGGYFNNDFAEHAWTILDTLDAASRLGKPTFILSAGFEPIKNLELSNKMLAVLPKVDLIICREPVLSPVVLQSFNVDEKKIAIAGDDAIELGFEASPPQLGNCVGINLRKADYSRVDSAVIKRLKLDLQQAITSLDAPVLSLPISMTGPSDPDAICELLSGSDIPTDGGVHLDTPEKVIEQAGNCRLIITGSYHAAVFALSQGVSVVALAASPHYKSKLEGLIALFGVGCRVLLINNDLTKEDIFKAVKEMWDGAELVRISLFQSAERQIKASKTAYMQIRSITDFLINNKQLANPISALGSKSVSIKFDYIKDNTLYDFYKNSSKKLSTLNKPLEQLMSNALNQFTLSTEEIASFRKNGYLGPFKAFEPDEMLHVQQVIMDRIIPTPTPYCPFGLRVRHLDSATIFDLCAAPEIIGRVSSLFGPDIILWNSNIFNKPPAKAGLMEEYPWHQDHYNWQMEPVLNISAWLAITPATTENGCVEVIPESHKLTIPPVLDTDPQLSIRFGGVASDPSYVDETKKVSLTLEPGQFFLFNERILHHSNPNRSRQSRLGLAMRFTVPIVEVSESFPCVLISGEDKMGFNQFVDKPTDEPDIEWLRSLPAEHHFAFDKAIPGMGWHVRESAGDVNFAWTGLEPKSWIDFRPLKTGNYSLCIVIIHVLTPDTINHINVYINDVPVKLTKQKVNNTFLVLAKITDDILLKRPDRIRVTLESSSLNRPCDINEKSMDKRTLGVAVSSILIT